MKTVVPPRLSPTLSRYPVEMLLHLLNNWDDFDDFKNIGFYYWSRLCNFKGY